MTLFKSGNRPAPCFSHCKPGEKNNPPVELFWGKVGRWKHHANKYRRQLPLLTKPCFVLKTTHRTMHLFAVSSDRLCIRLGSLTAESETRILNRGGRWNRARGEAQPRCGFGYGPASAWFHGELRSVSDHGVSFTCGKGNSGIPPCFTGCGGRGSDTMSQAFPGETALFVKGSCPMKGTAVSCQQPALPLLGEGCPSWAKDIWTEHQGPLLRSPFWPTNITSPRSSSHWPLCRVKLSARLLKAFNSKTSSNLRKRNWKSVPKSLAMYGLTPPLTGKSEI